MHDIVRSTGQRTSGLLFHPTSLPGRYGIGDLGDAAYAFVDFLQTSGQHLWQVLPLGPTGYEDSPYSSFSTYAGNPLLISPEKLRDDGLLTDEDLANVPRFPDTSVDYGRVISYKMELLRHSFQHFKTQGRSKLHRSVDTFRAMHHDWLEDYALFAAIKEEHNGISWIDWEPTIAHRDLEAVKHWREVLCDQVQFHIYTQYLFYRQWQRLKRYANERGVGIIGDLPFYVAHDSADLWSNRDLFWLDADGMLTDVAGAPPDAYSAVGQLWGNPLYRWDVLAQQGYEWWVRRLQAVLSTFDMVRLDHFRGFAAFWAVPSTEETAVNGRWEPGPGAALFEAVQERLGRPAIIAEDLGVITPDVEALRDQFGFPGMRVLHYAFGSGPGSPSLPHNHPRNCVVYTGTHDNDTTAGWWASASPLVRQHVLEYLGYDVGEEVSWALIRIALASVANMAIVPLQDGLSLGSEARMNTPGRSRGNWSWRAIPDMLTSQLADRLRALTVLYQRAES